MFPASETALKEEAAVERRRKLEEERKKRIFDAKTRGIGVDKEALDLQVRQRKEQEQAEKDRDRTLEQQMLEADRTLLASEREIERQRSEVQKEISLFRGRFQQKPQAKEFDLNDPEHKKKDIPARVGDDDARLGASSLQRFDGEDLERDDRVRKQRTQQRDWVVAQVTEREQKKQFDEEMERLEVLRQQEVGLRLREVELEAERQRREVARETADFNRSMAEERKRADSEHRHGETLAGLEEIRTQLESAFLNEDLHTTKSVSPGRVVPYHFKGLFPQQAEAIRATQRLQQEELQQRRVADVAEKKEWDHAQVAMARELIASQRKTERDRALQGRELADDLRKQAEEARDRKEKMNALYANRVDESYFQQFGTSSR